MSLSVSSSVLATPIDNLPDYAKVFQLGRDLCSCVNNDQISEAQNKARALMNYGRMFIAREVLQDQSSDTLRVALDLVSALSNERIQFDDNLKYDIARVARLFLELTCMKVHREGRQSYKSTISALIDKLTLVISTVPQEQVGLIHQLSCAKEAVKAMENVSLCAEIQGLASIVLDNLNFSDGFNLGAGALKALLEKARKYLDRLSSSWFVDVLYYSWLGNVSGQDPDTVKEILNATSHGSALELAFNRVEICGDLIWRGNAIVQKIALGELENLVSFEKKFWQLRTISHLARLSQHSWEIRMMAVKTLGAISAESSPTFQLPVDEATKILFKRRIDEVNPRVKKVLIEFEKSPVILGKWRELFKKQRRLIEERLQDKKVEWCNKKIKINNPAYDPFEHAMFMFCASSSSSSSLEQAKLLEIFNQRMEADEELEAVEGQLSNYNELCARLLGESVPSANLSNTQSTSTSASDLEWETAQSEQ